MINKALLPSNSPRIVKRAGSPLAEELTDYWNETVWTLSRCPALSAPPPPNRRIGSIDFSVLAPNIGVELRYGLMVGFTIKKWLPSSGVLATQIRKIVRFLAEKLPRDGSLLDRSLEAWNLSLRTWLVEQGEYYESTRQFIGKDQKPRQYSNGNACLSAFAGIYGEVERGYDPRLEWELDVWDLRRIGVEINPTKSEFRLSFKAVNPDWLKEAAKQYMRLIVTRLSASSCSTLLNSVRKFGHFLTERHPDLTPEQIDRPLLLEYSAYLLEINTSAGMRRDLLLDFSSFLERAAREEWLPVPRHRLIYREDLPPLARRQPRFIPESVMRQLEEHLPSLELFWRQMLVVLSDCGMRVGELCALKLDCLSQDADGFYFLTYYQMKLKKEHTIPISPETAAVIIERRETVKAEGRETEYIFSFTPGNPVRQDSFSKKINEFFLEHQIRDDAGNLWRFQPHQLRHTVGTRMINNGVSQIMVQRYLGHETPVMTSVYAHIHDQTLKNQYEGYLERRGKTINAHGDLIVSESDESANTVDLQWFKRNVLAQALPNGYCGLPLPQGSCPHANACLTCAHFQTDHTFLPQHRAQLNETKRLVQISRERSWERQVEMNEKVEKNLEKIISALEIEEKNDGRSEKAAA